MGGKEGGRDYFTADKMQAALVSVQGSCQFG